MWGRKRSHQGGSGSPQASAVGDPRALSGIAASSGSAPRRRPSLFYDRWQDWAAGLWAKADKPEAVWTLDDLKTCLELGLHPGLVLDDEEGHAATLVLIVGLALLFGLAIAVPAIRALQEALEVLS